jgi:hypothetical protein
MATHPTGAPFLRVAGLTVWAVVIAVFVVYGVTRGLTWGAGILGATLAGVVLGLYITPRWFALGLVPLLGFSIGGLILSTHLSSTRGYAGGDWSVAAVVALAGLVDGVIATLALLVTLLARAPLRAAIRQRT